MTINDNHEMEEIIMAKKRSIKVYGQSGYKYQETPTIMLKGMWLKELGFEIGDYISVTCEDGRLVITPDAERAAVKAAEAEFMEREMKALQKRYEAEKVKIRAQMVAEPGARW
ncbi:MAG: type I toxin-antitoxin system SymE family toxin [Bacteroidales bacterium]|nr:type I toxin-antitoxin system SymE family toxin [Bacteroidales bacterium]